VSLILTHSPVEDDRHIRVPLWLMFLEWFSGQPHLQRNPNSLPWKWALDFQDEEAGTKERKFCAFVVSNPSNPVRNAAFEALNAIAPVSSGGGYKNNIGGPIHHVYGGGGGGGGDVAKHAFLKEHTYCICYENSSAPGYVTEKLLHAKLAGCVPLYWGTDASADFDPAGFLNFTGQEGELVEAVRRLEANPAERERIAKTPALDPGRLQKAKATLLRVTEAILELGGVYRKGAMATATERTAERGSAERFLPKPRPLELSQSGTAGAPLEHPQSGSAERATAEKATAEKATAEKATAERAPLFVTFATAKYLQSLDLALKGWKGLGLEGIVWLGHDVSAEQEEGVQKAHREGVTYRRLPADSPVAGFPDFWEPTMFGWKTWILRETCRDERLAGRTIIYSDAGAVWIKIPAEWIDAAQKEGILLFVDNEQKNKHWCTAEMIAAMNVTERELEQNQLTAGFQIFVADHPVPRRLYEEQFTWASKRECLIGPFETGTDREGHPVGHRCDQSILSILALRQRIACIVGNSAICTTSLRKTYQRDSAIYLHRGDYAGHRQAMPRVDDVWVVNLDRRSDRWVSWLAAHPQMQAYANRLPAVDGKSLSLTPALQRLFEGNDFHWKKSVVGCALSHILLWAQLLCEHPTVKNYLILEDDHRFKDPKWEATFAAAMAAAPPDAELLYFGGILPGNRPGYEMCTEPVNDVWATIKPNPFFTGGRGLAPIFHFCTYSYLLTRKGAEKLLAALRSGGCKTSIDHFLGWPAFGLKKYVMRDLMASCFQDDDPAYVNSAFDDMKRVDSFDSDIWNNKECFEPSKENEKGGERREGKVELWQALQDVLGQAPHSIQTARTLRSEPVEDIAPASQLHVFYFDTKSDKHDGQVEGLWLKDLHAGYTLHPFQLDAVLRTPMPWLLVARPNIPFWSAVCAELDTRKKPYCVLHLSDEFGADALDLYKSPFCKKVVRNYVRPLESAVESKVSVIPLGYAVRPPTASVSAASVSAASALPSLTKREYAWSFHGSRWFGREAQLAPLQSIGPHSCKWQDGFLAPTMTPPADYSRLLLQSRFVPVPRGNNCETFRLYEALEHGCIPLYVRTEGDTAYWQWLRRHLTLVELPDWNAAAHLVRHLEAAPDAAEQYRQGLLAEWAKWKESCKKTLL
jgi:GR25 family glycosyltransferase involved in LPS biosynthesis